MFRALAQRRAALLLAGLLWLGCSGSLFRIRVSDSTTTVVERGTWLEQLFDYFGFDDFISIDIFTTQELENQGVSPGDVNGVYLRDFSLEAVAPAGADLSFIDRMTVYVEAPGLPRQRLAWADDFPEGRVRVDFEVDDQLDLTDYVVSRSMSFVTQVSGWRPSEDTTVEASYTLTVGVTRQGACGGTAGDTGS